MIAIHPCSRCSVALIAGLLLAGLSVPVAATERRAAATVRLLAGPAGPESYVRPVVPARPRPEAATFIVTYSGFSPAARAAFQRAVDIWAAELSSTVPITIDARYTPLGTGVLGSAGPSFIWRDFAGAPRPDTWYVDALANRARGAQLDAGPDILADFSSVFPNWHFGRRRAPAGKYDFTTVVLHEIGHGLGVLGGAAVSAADRGFVLIDGAPIVYSRFVENGGGKAILNFAENSEALSAQLRRGKLFFDSPQVRSANGNLRAKLFAPSVFQPGSSYSHLDEAAYLRGNPNSLMTPQLGLAETIRSPGPIILAMLRTMGW